MSSDHRRPTIADVAAAVGVSKMTVSLSMNGRPGVSEPTRKRVQDAAAEMGYRPNAFARSLAGARIPGMALVLRREAGALAEDAFYMQLIAGLQDRLTVDSASLVLHVVPDPQQEETVYRVLAQSGRIDAALIIDVEAKDQRAALLAGLGLPAIALGGPGTQFATLASDDEAVWDELFAHLVARGHRVVARVGGPESFWYTGARSTAFVQTATRHGVRPLVREGAADVAAARALTEELLDAPGAPTAFVYDNDMLTMAGLGLLRERGLTVPDTIAVVSWDGSLLSDALPDRPTTVRRDLEALGRAAGEALLDAAQRGTSEPGFLAEGHDHSRPRLLIGTTT